jgi:hypothetical protein
MNNRFQSYRMKRIRALIMISSEFLIFNLESSEKNNEYGNFKFAVMNN